MEVASHVETRPLGRGALACLGVHWQKFMFGFILFVTALVVSITVKTQHPGRSIAPPSPSPSPCNITLQVAKSGDAFRTISYAVQAAPDNSSFRICIRIPSGVYKENVRIGYKKTNIVFVGDGKENTVLTSGLSSDGFTLFVLGYGFIAIDMTITRWLGQNDNISTIVHNWADKSIFYRCRLVGYYNVLTLASGRHFYRDCEIVGFQHLIVGDSHASFQNCCISAIKPHFQDLTVMTWLTRLGLNYPDGVIYQNCIFGVTNVTQGLGKTYIGDPQAYTVTVLVNSYLEVGITDLVVNTSMPIGSLFAVRENTGPGITSKNYSGVVQLTSDQVAEYTLETYTGTDWLSSFIPYDAYLV